MSKFEDHIGQPSHAISREQVRYLRRILEVHGNDPVTGTCRICDVPSCPDWHSAYDQLATDGQLMAEPERWLRSGIGDSPQ